MTNVQTIISSLKSPKIRERQEALTSLREVFSQDEVIAGFHTIKQRNPETKKVERVRNPMLWLPVFQGLFEAIGSERSLALNPKAATSSGTALRRLSDTVSVLRWLIERLVEFVDEKRVVQALFNHLTQMLTSDRTSDGRIFKAIALDYAKTLKCLVSHRPHLDNIEDHTWVEIVEISFNVILDDPIDLRFATAEQEALVQETDSDMYVDDDPAEDPDDSEDLPASVAGTSKKRARPANNPIVSPRTTKSQATPRRNGLLSVSLEQVEFVSLLSIMIASPMAPLLSESYTGLASGTLLRLERFLQRYPSDSSLLPGYLTTLSSTLNHLSLNKKYDVERFARSTWSGLVRLWGTKDKRLKEGLIVVLRTLFPFTICPSYSEQPKLPHFDCAEEIGRLLEVLDGEAENRWGVDGLSLESLRLQVNESVDKRQLVDPQQIFMAKTFGAGWNFDSEQALSWAILELHADCVGKLLQLSESMDSRVQSKRIKLVDPISALLSSIEAGNFPLVRSYRLQTLLFFVDRHWPVVHQSLKERIISKLWKCPPEDATVQSWVFLNFAAIAHAEGLSPHNKNLDTATWDPIWAHAIRKANVPAMCRAACHAGHVLLASSHLLTSHRMLLEIESFTKDIDVQGPAYPFDSVCMLLSQSLTIASQDVRLYRLHLEDKVLSWLVDSWKLTRNKMTMAPNAIQDILHLLETICCLTKRVDLIVQPLLPPSAIVDSMIAENQVRVIQDYILYAKLPSFVDKRHGEVAVSSDRNDSPSIPDTKVDTFDGIQRVTPGGRERKVSSFLIRTMESIVHEWGILKDTNTHPTAEMARQSLDFAIAALTFESLLALNGISPDRQVLQGCSNLITMIIPLLMDSRWTTPEKLLVAHALEVLVGDEQILKQDTFQDGLAPPGPGSGIKEKLLQDLLTGVIIKEKHSRSFRLKFLRLVWQNAETQEVLNGVLKTLRTVLTDLLRGSSGSFQENAMDVDDNDGFGPIRTANRQTSVSSTRSSDDTRCIQHLFQICIGFLACGPFLQSPSAEPTRDKDLTKLVIESAGDHPDNFFILCPVFFSQVRQCTLHLPVKSLDEFLAMFGDLLSEYRFSRSEPFQRLLLDPLTSCLGVWKNDDIRAREVHQKFRELCCWLSKSHHKKKIRSWSLRDGLACLIDQYLLQDPTQVSWLPPEIFKNQNFHPTSLLHKMNTDPDFRVRFRVATINARLFSLFSHSDKTPLGMYIPIRDSLSSDIDSFEHMVTRMLALGNIMIVSSDVRRGPYWNLLETCLHTQLYSNHIEAILKGVSERLGMFSLASLFEPYASQLAFSIKQSDFDFLSVPPHLLGYRDRRQYAEATFRAFTPTNIITGGTALFENHCKVLQKTVVNGLQDCFGDIVGFQIAYVFDQPGIPDQNVDEIIRKTMAAIPNFDMALQDNMDGIVVQILRSLGDQDCSGKGPIASTLDSGGARIFHALTRFCVSDTSQSHTLNLPAFPTEIIIRSLNWLASLVPEAFTSATTYHVTQELMNAIHQTPLVYEQSRLINALSLWLAFRSSDLQGSKVLPTLVHGATLLLSQSDLACSAQSILDCAFRLYRQSPIKDPHLPNILIRICSIAHDYTMNGTSRSNSELGTKLIKWISQHVCELHKVPAFQASIRRALSAWPHQLSPQLMTLHDETDLGGLSSVLDDQKITSNKFCLVRRFKDHAAETNYDEDLFSKTHFWRLKDCMPSPDRLQDEDVGAFADLLSLCHGNINSFNIEQPNLYQPRLRHRQVFKKIGETTNTHAARDSIILGLLVMLEDEDPSHVSNAYHTLRFVMSALHAQDPGLAVPKEYQERLELLKMYRRSPRTRPIVDLDEMLKSEQYLNAADNFPRWVSLITVLLSDTLGAIDAFFGQLSSIFSSDIAFAEEALPILVHTLLYCKKDAVADPISCKKILSDYFMSILLSTSTDISCIRCIVDIVLHLRNFKIKDHDQLAYNKWLELDFNLLARSAILCGAYTTALLFVELASEQELQGTEDCKAIEDVLYEIYAHIDEPDGFYGIKTDDLHLFLIKRFHHEHQWDKAFRFHGAALEAGATEKGEEGLLKSFHSFGFDHLAIETLRNMSSDSSNITPSSSISYKLGWRTETWDLPDQCFDVSGVPLYRSLRSIYRERDSQILDTSIRSALFQEMKYLRSLGSESLAEIRAVSRDLMCLSQINQWRQSTIPELLETRNTSLSEWKNFVDLDDRFQFDDLESIMATRIALVRSARQKEERQQVKEPSAESLVQGLKDIEKACLIRLSQAARASGRVQIALNSVVRAQRLNAQPSLEVSEEFANVLWLQGEERSAVQFLQNLISKTPGSKKQTDSQKALWLSRLGTWTSEAFLAKPNEIWVRYFSPAISLLDGIHKDGVEPDCETSAKIYRECAVFAERQYHTTSKSPEARRLEVYTDRKAQEIKHRTLELKREGMSKSDISEQERAIFSAQKLHSQDSERLGKYNALRDTFLKQAIDMHSRCLRISTTFDNDSAIRFCSLWFANFDQTSISLAVEKGLERIPSYKLIFLAHQLTARLSNPPSASLLPAQGNLQNLILKMCQEHPFHILYQVYCLSDHSESNRHQSRQHSASQSTQTDRGTAATNILDRLRNLPTVGIRVQNIEKLCDAYLEWAKFPIAKNKNYQHKPSFDVPRNLKIMKDIKDIKVPVSTARTPIDLSMKYENLIWIQSYEAHFTTAGGVNLPKINTCKGIDGNSYKQLFKGEGKDDLRQDAVMEQVFDLVNSVLKHDRETRRRELRVRDYKVIPLASQAGLLEFVGNTSPLRDWVSQAHQRYHPRDLKPQEVSNRIKKVQTEHPSDHDKQHDVFMAARKKFKPVMRHYFTEKHKTPISWFKMRLCYTRSVATTSIVGHVLGLGDRHTSNILLDNVLGEVVHIDLGIAFDQGKLLTVPELVPFRMTADIVDGMGISGTSGVFQRCAQETLRVLRQESELIMTVLEVFKHDPLHSWSASEFKVQQAQQGATNTDRHLGIGIDMSSGTAEEAADRALSSVSRKLDKSLSVESTVNELIAEATDTMNLATIYHGWAAHL